ncbi:MAG: hypothetical protein KDB94_06820, partial [Acidobacteria bacterium]|nr:hypothetical protein [Acidobacteriota bacterium]
ALVAAAPGTAQLTAGDERGRTQRGNTNAWCRDDEIGWVHWTPHEEAEARRAFVAEALATRRRLGLGAIPAATARIAPFEAAEDLAFFETGAFALLRRERGGARRVVAANATAHDVEIPLPAATAGASWRIELATERGVAFDPSGSSLALPAGCVALLADGGVSLEAVPEELSGDRAGAAP